MELLDFTIRVAEKAGKRILKEAKKIKVEKKGIRDLVTNADKAAEKLIIKEIQKQFPDHGIIAEEQAQNKNEINKLSSCPYIWIIDPLDGTTNFTHGLQQFAVSIGVIKTASAKKSKNFEYITGELICGVVFAPKLGEIFYAEKGKGAYRNGKKIQVSKRKKLADSLMVTGFPYKDKEINLPYLEKIVQKARGMRRFGAASLDMCYIAAGHFDGYWEFGLKAWDIAAGTLILNEAGGKVTDTNGNTLDLFGQDLLCSNGHIHKETIELFSKIQ
jgi:myo-inositol-1(or 4)-monophosphatase